MRIGVVFPQTELGGDPGAVRAFAAAASELGYAHIAVFDHVVGADLAVHRGSSGPYDVHTRRLISRAVRIVRLSCGVDVVGVGHLDPDPPPAPDRAGRLGRATVGGKPMHSERQPPKAAHPLDSASIPWRA
jgi:hypothetical protein